MESSTNLLDYYAARLDTSKILGTLGDIAEELVGSPPPEGGVERFLWELELDAAVRLNWAAIIVLQREKYTQMPG